MSAMRMNKTESAIGNVTIQGVGELTKGASQAGVGTILALAALLGSWGVLCLLSAVAGSGGLLALGRGWLSAITGM